MYPTAVTGTLFQYSKRLQSTYSTQGRTTRHYRIHTSHPGDRMLVSIYRVPKYTTGHPNRSGCEFTSCLLKRVVISGLKIREKKHSLRQETQPSEILQVESCKGVEFCWLRDLPNETKTTSTDNTVTRISRVPHRTQNTIINH